jgi:hypothetical protein
MVGKKRPAGNDAQARANKKTKKDVTETKETRQCEALTKTGKQCKNKPPTSGGKPVLCAVHQKNQDPDNKARYEDAMKKWEQNKPGQAPGSPKSSPKPPSPVQPRQPKLPKQEPENQLKAKGPKEASAYSSARIEELQRSDAFLNSPGVVFGEDVERVKETIELGIASVTAAITSVQSFRGGFSFLQGSIEHPNTATVVRPSRPLLVPVQVPEENLFVLVGLQVNFYGLYQLFVISPLEEDDIEEEQREQIEGYAMGLLKESHWNERIPSGKSKAHLPASPTWIYLDQHTSLDEGQNYYYMIFNAWALAMGLEPVGPVEDSDETQLKFQLESQAMLQLALNGSLNWEDIYGFLVGYGIIANGRGAVPKARRFANTRKFLGYEEFTDYLELLKEDDKDDWASAGTYDPYEVGMPSRVMGFSKEGPKASDDESGDSDEEHDDSDGKHDKSNKRSGKKKTQPYGWDKDPHVINARQFLSSIPEDQKFVTAFRSLQRFLDDEKNGLTISQLDNDHCKYFKIRQTLIRELSERTGYEPSTYSWQKPVDDTDKARVAAYLQDEQVMLGIMSVVAAIEKMPLYVGPRSALTTHHAVAMALVRAEMGPLGEILHAGGCWFIPIVLAETLLLELNHAVPLISNGKKFPWGRHTILAVLKKGEVPTGEDKSKKREIILYLVDSHNYCQDARVVEFIRRRVEKAAERLNWTKGIEDTVGFPSRARVVAVPRQAHGWECGLYAVMNAWIYALGLTPDERDERDDEQLADELLELVRQATEGRLDSKTLVAWLLCRRRIVEDADAAFREHRVFDGTKEFQTVSKYEDFLEEEQEDQIAAMIEEEEADQLAAMLEEGLEAEQALQRGNDDDMDLDRFSDDLDFLSDY